MASRVITRGPLHNMEARTVAASRTILSQVMLPGDANPVGTVHGGTIAKLVDSTGAVAAMRHCRAYAASIVTVRIDAMNFVQPIHFGEVVTLRASVNDVGRTSLEVGVRVEAENVRMADVKHVASAYLVYVALDDAGNPTAVPPLLVATDEERQRQHAARARRAARRRTSGR
jgi:uncharacterized protein (TIGR00369 family)